MAFYGEIKLESHPAIKCTQSLNSKEDSTSGRTGGARVTCPSYSISSVGAAVTNTQRCFQMTRKVSAPFTFFARAAAGERPRTPAPRAPGGREAAVWGGTSDEGRARGQPAGGRARGACPRSPPGPLPRGPSSSPTRPAPQGPGAPGASTSRAGPTRPGDARGPPDPGLRRPEPGNTWSLRAKSAHHPPPSRVLRVPDKPPPLCG